MDIERLEHELTEAQRRVRTGFDTLRRLGEVPGGRWWRRKPANAEPAAARAELDAAREARAAAEGALAAARGEEYVVPFDLGMRWSGGAPMPHLLSSGYRSFVAFHLDESDTEHSLGLAELKGCVSVKIGFPHEDVLLFGGGHPLYTRGLDGYGAYVVENSRWLAELIEIDRTHEDFDPRSWDNVRHFLLAFHDNCVEAIARAIEARPVQMSMRALLRETIEKLVS